jgi:transposase
MNTGSTVLAQLMDFVPRHEFRRFVKRYRGHHKVKSFSCWDQFLCMAFAQLTFRESLRDIEACLRSMSSRLYHCGFRGRVSRSTLAEANERRDWRIYSDFAQVLINRARALYRDEDLGVELDKTVYALDSTTIDLCLSLFPWAPSQQQKAAVKLHTLLDLRGSIPTFIRVTDGRVHDVRILDEIVPEPGSFYVLDRGYISFRRLHRLHRSQAFFIIRARRDLRYRRIYSHPTDRSKGLRYDQTIVLTGVATPSLYPEMLRRVGIFDQEHQHISLLTNHFGLPASTVGELYKHRWKVELFFRWIKQHLRIKSFFGTSENTVKTQIWIAVAVYVLVAIIKKELKIERPLYTILQVISVNPFSQTPLNELLTQNENTVQNEEDSNQLILFE